MRALLIAFSLTMLFTVAAQAQSELFFDPKAPVAAGQQIKGLLTQANGVTTLGDVTVQGVIEDDLFAYWTGKHRGDTYYYDPYTTYWRSGPIRYLSSSLNFQGEQIDGWVRQFGNYLDTNNFFGRDGIYYKRIIIKRNRTRNTNRRRQIIYSYFINTQTLERSDSGAPPYLVIGDASSDFIKAQMQDKESIFRQILDDNPAFPKWQSNAFEAPSTVVVHNGAPEPGDDGMVQLSSSELGALTVEK